MKFPLLLMSIFVLLITSVSTAQYYNSGQDPGSLKWMQIKTDRFTVIYPKSFGEAGIDFAKSLDDSYSLLTPYFPGQKLRIPVIIHNYTIESNGYVAWAPKRMEIYPTPEQNTLPLDTYKELAIHELTHGLQMQSLNAGFTKAMSLFTGEQFTGFISSLLPLWFLEGDAVFSESVLTESGRGRSPSFQKQLKAISVEKGGVYKYDKIVNGSFRDFIPDYYHSGYQMIAWSFAKYDPGIWGKVLNYTAKYPFTINPVNLSLRKNASLTKRKLFRETFDTLNTIWASDDFASNSESFEILNPSKGKEYANYYSPLFAGKDTIIAVKTSLSAPPSFVLIDPFHKSEKKIHIPGNIYPYVISYGKGKLVWVETQSDPRWENRAWSVIKIMDIKSRRTRQLSVKSRYMSAAVSPDGNIIAATESLVNNTNNLVIIDSRNGKIVEHYPVPGNAYLQKPQWDETGSKLTVIFLTEKGEGVMAYDLKNHLFSTLIQAGKDDIQSSFFRNDSLFFISSSSGTENVYLLGPDQTIYPLTRSRFGTTDLNVAGDKLLFSDYSSSGNNICIKQIPLTPVNKNIHNSNKSFLINRFDAVKTQPISRNDYNYNPEPYRKWQHLFRLHSWMPFYADLDEIKSDPLSVSPGATIMTQNHLSTLMSTVGYEYADGRHKFHTSVKWLGWYPVFETRIDFGDTPVIQKLKESVADPSIIKPGAKLINTIYLPLYFRRGRFSQYLYLSASSEFQNNYIYIKEKGAYDQNQMQLLGRFYFSNYFISGLRDINPKWAQTIDFIHSGYPFDKNIYGTSTTLKSALYFPGILKNNGIKIRLETEEQHPKIFILGNRVSFPRSYENIISEKSNFLSSDYYFPLVYPDFNISSLLYLTRIRADLFYDISRSKGNYLFETTSQGTSSVYHDYNESFRSFGVELMSDFYVFRIPYMVSAGVQAAWRNFGEMPYLKMLFSINLYGMTIGKSRL